MDALKSFLRVITVLLALGFIVSCAAIEERKPKEIDLYIWAGQSNAQGWKGNAAEYPPDLEKLDQKIKFYYVFPTNKKTNFSSDGKWIAMGPQKGRFPKGHFGPEVSFARSLASESREVAIFKYSKGGTGLGRHWRKPGDGGLYDGMVKEYGKAVKVLETDGYKVNPRAFIWIQGESDSTKKGSATAYADRLKIMINHLRQSVTGVADLRIILGVDEQNPSVKKLPTVLEAQKEFARKDKFTVYSSMIGLEKADKTHLKPKALIEHGERIYKAYKTVERKTASAAMAL